MNEALDLELKDKTYKACIEWDLGHRYNISKLDVKEITECYFKKCKDWLLEGEVIDFVGLFRITPNYVAHEQIRTIAYNCKEVAQILNKPYYTVYNLMMGYIEYLTEMLLEGRTVIVKGLAKITALQNEEGKYVTIHSHISTVLTKLAKQSTTNVTGFRVSTSLVAMSRLKEMNEREEATM